MGSENASGRHFSPVNAHLSRYQSIIAAVALFLLVDMGVLVMNFFIAAQIKQDAASVNLAGRQRMLSQRMAKTLYQLQDRAQSGQPNLEQIAELQLSFVLFDTTLNAFRYGGVVQGGTDEPVHLPAVQESSGQTLLKMAIRIWDPYRALVQATLTEASPANILAAARAATANNLALLSLMNDLTTNMEKAAASKADSLRLVQTAGMLLAILNFIFILFHFAKRLRRSDQALEAAKQETDQILETVNEGLFLLDQNLHIGTQYSKDLKKLFNRDQLAHEDFIALLSRHVSAHSLQLVEKHIGLLLERRINGDLNADFYPLNRVEMRFQNPGGEEVIKYLNFRFSRVIEAGALPHILVTVSEVTQQVKLEQRLTSADERAEQLIYLAERDSLTGLYNRHRFQIELRRALGGVDRKEGCGALLFFDLDEFKYINDTYGHRAGDAVLIRVAGEVSSLVRHNEIFSRLGGDEFAVLMPQSSEADAIQLAERIIRGIAQIPFRFEGQNIRLTTSLGVALYPRHGSSPEELIARADAAMYQAKDAGKNAWRVYHPGHDSAREMGNRLSWQERIGNALDKDLMRLHFQGVYRASDRVLTHLEVLVRMIDETDPMRLIMPGNFIPFAEHNGKIAEIDRWVIRESVRRLSYSPRIPPLAIKISGRSFDQLDLPRYISQQLLEFNVAPQRLIVELTETSAVTDLHDAQRFIEALQQAGCRVCLDDFGAGFSSFAYLKHLKVDVLKIDGLFVRDLANDRDNQIFVKAIVDVARGMRKSTIAEFVENAETLAMLQQFGVDMVQGYFLDTPCADHPALQVEKS